jgi:hypothetical protein
MYEIPPEACQPADLPFNSRKLPDGVAPAIKTGWRSSAAKTNISSALHRL